MTQEEKGKLFRALHARSEAFIIPNPWDVGTARLLARVGFEALATTSAGCAFAKGQKDGSISRDEALEHTRAIASATDLPVNADLENGFGDSPDAAAETITMAAKTGIVGASIEDTSRSTGGGPYEIRHAAEPLRAAAEAAHTLPFEFTLTARAENYLLGKPDLHDTIKRLQAFQEAGADVLYAPGLKTKEDIAAVVQSVDQPVNVIMGLQGVHPSLAELSALGVKRVSVGSALSRAALGAFLRGAEEMKQRGTFTFPEGAVSYRDIMAMF